MFKNAYQTNCKQGDDLETNRKFALIVSYYLSKFDRKALQCLGYTTFNRAFEDIGFKLNVPPNTIKNMRENFDPLHPNGRVGWYQRELSPSRLDVVEKFSHFSEDALTGIVKEILNEGNTLTSKSSLDAYKSVINNEEADIISSTRSYTTRGITGNKAEELFIEAFNNGSIKDFYGDLFDRRNDGCGYDFEVNQNGEKFAFEVKGLLEESGGINFTDKEWSVAKELGTNYIVVLISNIKEKPIFSFYIDPYNKLTPQKRVFTTVAINWNVSSNELLRVNDY